MRQSSLTNGGGGTLVADQINGIPSQFDDIRFSSSNNPQQQQQPIGQQKTVASVVASSITKGSTPSSPSTAIRNGANLFHPAFLQQQQQAMAPQHQGLKDNEFPILGRSDSGLGVGRSGATTIINENDFPSLGVRQSPSVNPFSGNNGQPGTPTAASITAGLIPSYSSKDASGSLAGLRNQYSYMRHAFDMNGSNEFNIQNEDFPALPGANNQPHHMFQMREKSDDLKTSGSQRGIQTHQNGRVTHIPSGMLNDQYGIAGILSFRRSDEHNKGLKLALGHDLTSLGLNLNCPDRILYQSFGGPFSDSTVRTQDIECNVPDEYRTSQHIKDKLPPIKLSKLGEDTLFFLFYNCPNEAYQMVAANELYTRDWRYHKTLQVWLTRSAYGTIKEQTAQYEKGSYNVFDPIQWRKIPKEMTLEYKDLEQRPQSLQTEIKPGNGSIPATTPGALQQRVIPTSGSIIGGPTNVGAGTPTGVPPGGSIVSGKPSSLQ